MFCTTAGARLVPRIAVLESDHPDRRFLMVVSAIATAVIDGEEPGPFNQADAEHRAREAMLPRGEVETLWRLSDSRLAERFGVPLDQVTRRRDELTLRH